MSPTLPVLLLGLAVGGTTTWLALRPPNTSNVLSPRFSPPPASVSLPAWSWRTSPTPPSLPANLTAPALAAWQNLRAPDGTPAAYPARASGLRALLTRLTPADFPRLLAALPPPDTEPHRRLRQIAFDGWVALDAPAAARWAATADSAFNDLLRQAARAWINLDAPAAAAWACALPDPNLAATLAADALAALARTHPDRALALANSRDDAFRAAVLPKLVAILAKSDPAAALQALPPGALNHRSGFYELRDSLRAWAQKDPSAALAWLAKQPSDPNESADWVAQLAETPDQFRTLGAIVAADPAFPQQAATLGALIYRWATVSDAANSTHALAWLAEHTDPALRLDAILSIAGSHPYDHPDQALPLVLSLPSSQRRTQTLGSILTAWNKLDPAAALAWMQTRAATDPGVAAASAQLQATQLADIARAEPATALAEWTRLADPRARGAAIYPIAEAWGKTDPASALRWQTEQAAALKLTYAQPSMNLLAAWGEKDPEAALRWTESYLANAPAEKASWLPQQLLGALGSMWNTTATRAATADLYSKIKDTALRNETLTTHVREWLTKDPAAAKAWLESHDALTPAQAAALLAPVR